MSKIALDIHGVIDREPEFFAWLSSHLRGKGWQVHILTGGRWEHNQHLLKEWKIIYDQFFSITDYHVAKGTPILPDCKDGDICIEDELWNSTKAQYCRAHGIKVIVDDSLIYKKYMPDYVDFVHWW